MKLGNETNSMTFQSKHLDVTFETKDELKFLIGCDRLCDLETRIVIEQ